MKLTSISDVLAILEAWEIQPQKSLGQNFLIDANILGIILDTAGIKAEDEVLEIGAGLGVLTEPLARVARRVVTVEKDPRLWSLLKERLQAFPNVELVCDDMMQVDHEALLRSGINKVVANLPYSVGSAILVNLVQAATPPAQLTVTLQQEVAKRLIAKPGHKDFGLLTLWTQLRYDTTIRKTISPTCFYPTPGVSSTIINLIRREQPKDDAQERHFFYALTKFAFAHRRKQLKTILCDAIVPIHSMHRNFPALAGSPTAYNPAPAPWGEGWDEGRSRRKPLSPGRGSKNRPTAEADNPAGSGDPAYKECCRPGALTGHHSTTSLQLSAENVLAAFQKLEIDPRTRPEDLSVEMWRRLANALSNA